MPIPREKIFLFFIKKYFTFFLTWFIINLVRLRKDLASEVYMKIQIANVRDGILQENKLKPVVMKNGKIFMGQLFFEPVCEEVVQVLDEIEIPDSSSNVEIAKALQPLNAKYAMDGKDTFGTNAHWAWMNGLAEKLDISYLGA